MGVVTDKSLQGLTTAVNNISTSGMSDSTGQAINSTLGTLMTNTTGQAINTTLQSLVGAISPAAANVTFNNTGTGLSASDVQSAITELNTVTTTTTGTGGFALRKIAKVCEIKGNGARADQLGTVPSDYRPASNSYLMAVIGDGTHYYSGYLFINSSTGEIQAIYLNGGTATRVTTSSWLIYICAHYIVS